MKRSVKLLLTLFIVLSVLLTLFACSNSKIEEVEAGYSGYGTLDYWYGLDENGKEIPVTDSNGDYVVSVKDLSEDFPVYAKAKLTYVSDSGNVDVALDTRTGIIAPSFCTRAGVFEYWYADNSGAEIILSDGTGKFKPFSELPEGLSITEIRAKTYTPYVILGEDGESVKVEGKVFYNELLKLTEEQLKAAAKPHYDISGFTATVGETEIKLNKDGVYVDAETDGYWQIDTAQRVEFTPQYTPHAYTVKLDSGSTENDVSNLPEKLTEQIVFGNAAAQLRIPKRIGYKFAGWLCVKGEQAVLITDSAAAYLNDYVTLNSNYLYEGDTVTLQPKWQREEYSLRFFVDGALLGDGHTLEYGVSLVPPTVAPLKSGYTFTGWYTKQDGGEMVDLSTATMPPQNADYYAHFTPNENKLILNGNGGKTALGEGTSQQIITYATSALIKENPFTRIGYSFSGWSATDEGAVQYVDMASYAMGAAAEYTLYAVWTPVVNTIVFNINGGNGGAMSQLQEVLTGVREVLPRNLYTHATLTFIGWSYEPGVSQQKAFEDKDEIILTDEILSEYATGEKKNVITLYAMWGTLQTRITFDGNGNSCGTAAYTQELTQNGALTLLSNRYNRVGYTFSNWLRNSDSATFANGAEYTFTTETEVSLLAQWSPKTYTVKLYEGYGSNLYTESDFVYDNNNHLNVPVRIGYSFDGYYDNEGRRYCDNDGTSTATWGIADNEQRLTAKWTAKDNRLEFNPNEGSGTMAPILLRTDSTCTLPALAFTRANFGFEGWNTKADGTGVAFSNEAQITMQAEYFTFDDTERAIANRVVTLYAQWKNYTVTYFGGEGALGTAPVESNQIGGAIFTLENNSFTKAGSTFLGWSDGNVTYPAGGSYVVQKSNIELTAVWYYGEVAPIWTVAQLNAIRNGLSGSYALCTDMDLDGAEWTPIGTSGVVSFVGTFDGLGHTVSNFTVTTGATYIGLFGYTSGTIKNLGVSDYTINSTLSDGTVHAGALVGYSNGGSISDCYATGNVSAASASVYVGGLIGFQKGSTVTNCFATGGVTASATNGSAFAGGVLGGGDGTVTGCYATGKVIATSFSDTLQSLGVSAGGLVGSQLIDCLISDCYATGDVTAASNYTVNVGGLVGKNDKGTITNCYATGAVSATSTGTSSIFCNTYVGGLVANNDGGTVSNSFAAGNVSANTTVDSVYLGGLVGSGTVTNSYYSATGFVAGTGEIVSLADLATSSWYLDTLDYSNDKWEFSAGNYPRIKGSTAVWVALPTECPQGSLGNPIAISTAAQLSAIQMDRSYILTADIRLDGAEWVPLGTATAPYVGIFNGGGHIINRLKITSTADGYVGLFGNVYGNISNLSVTDCFINVSYTDTIFAGGLIGYSYSGAITNCYSTGTVSASAADNSYNPVYAGGLLGYHNDGTISNSYATVSVTVASNNRAYIGGLIGRNGKGAIENCYATGKITATITGICAGGLVGETEGAIANCYATGNVTATSNTSMFSVLAGGLVGNCSNSTITDCYASGNVVATTTAKLSAFAYAGGLIGSGNATVNNCYATGTVTATTVAGGLIGSGKGAITNCYATGTVTASSSYTDASAGGLVGYGEGGSITNCFAIGYVTATTKSTATAYTGGLVGKTDEITVTNSFYSTAGNVTGVGETITLESLASTVWYTDTLGYSAEVWEFSAGYYPRLIGSSAPRVAVPTVYPEGSIGNPIAISTAAQLAAVQMDRSYILTADIDLGGAEWTPLGSYASRYVGFFNGDGHVVKNYTITSTSDGYVGLFSRLRGRIVNLGVTDFTIEASYDGYLYGGGLVGASSGAITNCYATGGVTANSTLRYAYVGGLVGLSDGTITNCYATGNVTASSSYTDASAGGLVGYSSGTITNCYAIGSVTASGGAYAGGLVGKNSGTNTNCYRADSQELMINGSVGNTNSEGTATPIANLQTEAFLTGMVGFGKYVSSEDLALNPNDVWVFGSGVFPTLYNQQ